MTEEIETPKYRITFLETGKDSMSSWDFTGLGKAKYVNGDIYEGEYLNGVRSGQGVYHYKNGYVYSGLFLNNVKQG